MKSAETILSQYVRDRGMLRSRQRQLILGIFLKMEKHPTARDLHEEVRKRYPAIGLATIYRAMKVICDAGLARQTDFADGVKRFEHKYGHEHHDHLVCLKCGRIIEVVNPRLEKLQNELAKKHGFTPVRHRMQIFGTCRKCGG
jgi:Fur family ferric uptake transcriptional regulator